MEKKEKSSSPSYCILSIVALILLLLLLTILYFSLFNPHKPILTIDSISLQNPSPQSLSQTNHIVPHGLMSICLNLSLSNPNNRATFYYENVGTSLYYKGEELGFVMVPSGAIRSKSTVRISMFLGPMSPSSSSMLKDIEFEEAMGHFVTFTSDISIVGDITYFGSFSHHVSISCHCILNLSQDGVVTYTCNQLN